MCWRFAVTRFFSIVGVVLLSLLCTVAHADQGKELSAKELSVVKEIIDRGEVHFAAGEWAMARSQYQKAHRLSQHPTLVFNIGSTYSLEGDEVAKKSQLEDAKSLYALAIESYKNYQSQGNDEESLALAVERIAVLEAKIAGIEKTLAQGRERAAAEPAKQQEWQEQEQEQEQEQAEVQHESQGSNVALTRKIGFGVGGAGLLTIAGAIYFTVRVENLESDLDDLGGIWTPANQRTLEDAESAERNARILWGVGIGATAIGAGLLYWSREKEQSERLVVVPSVGATSAQLSLLTTF